MDKEMLLRIESLSGELTECEDALEEILEDITDACESAPDDARQGALDFVRQALDHLDECVELLDGLSE